MSKILLLHFDINFCILRNIKDDSTKSFNHNENFVIYLYSYSPILLPFDYLYISESKYYNKFNFAMQ